MQFDFRVIEMPDGNQIIDRDLKTPYNASRSDVGVCRSGYTTYHSQIE